jgi:hypothetical protein
MLAGCAQDTTARCRKLEQGGTYGSDDATEVIASCRDDMKALWEDKAVQALLQKHNNRLQDSAGL